MEKSKFRKIRKKELLEIMLSQAKKIKELENELSKTKEKLETKKINIQESGSLAEASLKLNKIFENAQQAIEQYKYNVEEQCKKITSDTKKECKLKKEKIINETLEKCKKKETKLEEKLTKVDKKISELKIIEKELKKKEKELSKSKIKNSKKKIEITNKEIKVNVNDLKHTINQKEVRV